MNNLKALVYYEVEQYSCFCAVVDSTSSLSLDLNYDSEDLFDLLVSLEDTFGIDLQEDNLKGWYTVEDVIDSVIEAGG